MKFEPVSKHKIIFFGIFFLILGAFPLIVLIYSYYRDCTTAKEIFITKQKDVLDNYESMINHEIDNLFSDLEYLYLMPSFQAFFKGEGSKENVLQSWFLYSQTKGIYDQIRFLDAQGMEIIRINYANGNSEIVGPEKLQDKGGRYYFSMLKDFDEPTILLSKFDLNIENKKVEIPYKPMLRISLPLYDQNENFAGAIVLNYLGANFLDKLSEIIEKESNKVFVLNADGYILLGPNKEDEWGFMFEEGKEKTFDKIYTSDWRVLSNSESDVYQSEIGLYLNKTIDNGYIVQENARRASFSRYKLHSMDKFLRVIILGEGATNPILDKRLLLGILSSRWKVILTLLILSGILSYYFASLYIRKRSAEVLKDQYKSAMKEVVNALEVTTSFEDDDTGNHIKRVCHYSRALALGFGLPKEKSELISDLASLHDIGKVGIHDSILKKRGNLTDEEREAMKRHVEIGYEVVKNINVDHIAQNIVRYHHENWDRSGYTSGLKSEEIPLEARIVSLADVYDALRSERTYKPAYSHEKAVEMIKLEKGKKFDPKIVDVFLRIEKQFNAISTKLSDT